MIRIERVINNLEVLLDFLQYHEQNFSEEQKYSNFVLKYLDMIKAASGNEKEQVNIITEMEDYMFRGMGSLNDFFICKENDHVVEDEDLANKKLDIYRSDLYRNIHDLLDNPSLE